MNENVGLVLEGGGMRGVFTSGVLDAFMEHDLYLPYVVAVSAGALNSLSYLSRQKDRSRYINVHFANDPRYLNFKNLLKGQSIFNMDFLFNEVSYDLVPFDVQAFESIKERLVVSTTNCETGEAVYFDNSGTTENVFMAVRASSSLPLVGKPVELDGYQLLDGGIVDPIPVKKSIEDGNQKHVIILTRPKGYRKKRFRARLSARLMYAKQRKLITALDQRHHVYNQTMDLIDQLEEEGKAFVIRPKESNLVKRTEKDSAKLNELHQAGYQTAHAMTDALKKWL